MTSPSPNPSQPAHMTLVLAVCCPVCHFDLVSLRRLLSDYPAELRRELVTELVWEGEQALHEHLAWTHHMEPTSPTAGVAHAILEEPSD